VDYEARSAAIATIEETIRSPAAIDPHDNRVKLLVTARLLETRRRHAELFARGGYRPLAVLGTRASHVVAFARGLSRQCSITIVSRHTCSMAAIRPSDWWADTAVALPADLHGRLWRSQIVSGDLPARDFVHVGSTFGKLPMLVAVG
jgi:(1->4)-alpha-D-glucan 1-alpha-D-glucosylmutase